MTDQVARRRKQMPFSCRGIYDRAMSGRCRPAAVKAMCLECTGWLREAVTNCTAVACPLYPYRPFVERPKRMAKPE